MLICIDVDNVVNNFTEVLIGLYNKYYDEPISLDQFTTYNFNDCFSFKTAEALRALCSNVNTSISLNVIAGAQNAIKKLQRHGHIIYFATATHYKNFDTKVEWLRNRFPTIPVENIICITDKSLLKADILIEDNLSNLISFSGERICFDYPWNRSFIKDFAYDIRRVYNWDDVIEAVNRIEAEAEVWK